MTAALPLGLGWDPIPITVLLSKGGDWVLKLVPADADTGAFPEGTTAKLDLYPPGTQRKPIGQWPAILDTWDAALDPETGILGFSVAAVEADAVPRKAYARLTVTFPTGVDYVWCKGLVERND
jgi:hypothetical protein